MLTDGVNTYYYNDNYSDRNKQKLTSFVTVDQTVQLDDFSESQLENMVEKNDNLLEDLENAFIQEGLPVTVNEETGEMSMDSSILFGGDSAVLTEEGKAFLDKFIKVYVTILYSDKYVDLAASRRVSFRFVINLEAMQ